MRCAGCAAAGDAAAPVAAVVARDVIRAAARRRAAAAVVTNRDGCGTYGNTGVPAGWGPCGFLCRNAVFFHPCRGEYRSWRDFVRKRCRSFPFRSDLVPAKFRLVRSPNEGAFTGAHESGLE